MTCRKVSSHLEDRKPRCGCCSESPVSGLGVDKAEISGASARMAPCPKRSGLLLLLVRDKLPQQASMGQFWLSPQDVIPP